MAKRAPTVAQLLSRLNEIEESRAKKPVWKAWLTDPKFLLTVFTAGGMLWNNWRDGQEHKIEDKLKAQKAYEWASDWNQKGAQVMAVVQSQQRRHPERPELFDTITINK